MKREGRGTATPLPTGVITFLLTDIEGSTRLWEQHPETMRIALARHHALLAAAIEQNGGTVVKSQGEGDSIFAVFVRPVDAVTAAVALQKALLSEPWPAETPLRVRVALHTGEAELRDGDYFGAAVNRCARLRAAAHGGQVLLSAASQELVRDLLPEGVALRDLSEHRLRDLTRPERIYQLLYPDLPADFPPLRGLDAAPNNLPIQRGTLLGREAELAALRRLLLRDDVGLVTLTGPGGTGKTRLALQVAAELLDDFPDGVSFVELAPIRDPALVAATIAQTLGVRESGDQPVQAMLRSYVRQKSLLLLLDNFEQVLDAAPVVADLLAAAAHLRILVTSRAVLHLHGEQEYPVPPLSVPDLKRLPNVAALSQYAAVELFIRRAVTARADFIVTNENAPAVAEICHRLDGLPLAIILAGARVKLFSPEALLARLGRRLSLLTGGARDLPARHQTLRDTIAWSYELLDEEERALFRRLSVFVGGFTLEAAETVSGGEGEVLDLMTSLSDKSLLRQAVVGGEPRFGMLETIREFGQELLAESGEEEQTRRRHSRFFLELAERAESELKGPRQIEWLDRLDVEHDNVRAALERSVAGVAVEEGLRLAAAVHLFWAARGHLTEGRRWLARLMSRFGGDHLAALFAAGHLAWYQGDYDAALPPLTKSLTRSRESGDRPTLGLCLAFLANVEQNQGADESARARLLECETILREAGDRWSLARGLHFIGIERSLAEDHLRARERYEESLALSRGIGDGWSIGITLNQLGETARSLGEYSIAAPLYREALALTRATGEKYNTVLGLINLGTLSCVQGEIVEAADLFSEALTLARELGHSGLTAFALVGIAGVLVAKGRTGSRDDNLRAARLLATTEIHLEAVRVMISQADLAFWIGIRDAARSALGDAAFEAAWAEGQAMSLDAAVAFALQDADEA